MRSVRWILAVDLDGTLVRRDGTVANRDAEAITRARSSGIEVVFTTARFPAGARSVAEGIEADVGLVCADGALVLDRHGATLHERTLSPAALSHARSACPPAGIGLFHFSADTWSCRSRDLTLARFVSGWAEGNRLVCVEAPSIVRCHMALAVGAREQVATIDYAGAHRASTALDIFELGGSGVWAARLRHASVSKTVGLRDYAVSLGLDARRTAAVGNGLNDVDLLEFATRSYAMGDALDVVKASAARVLRATSLTGGGIDEVVADLVA